jgi:hypothetical protein
VSCGSHSEVHHVLSLDDRTHAAVLAGFRAGGGNTTRWLPWDMATMARAMTAVEDAIELERDSAPRREIRMRLRELRRRLENASDDATLSVPYSIVANSVRAELGAPGPWPMSPTRERASLTERGLR